MSDGPLSFLRSWEGFLPPNTVVMAKRGPAVQAGAGGVPNSEPWISATESALASTVKFGFEVPGHEEPSAKDLFTKILSALELAPTDYAVFANASEGPGARIQVRFTADDGDSVGTWNGAVLTTYSLHAMLRNPALKKPVWNHLKQAIQKAL
jgi:hypothetical protein